MESPNIQPVLTVEFLEIYNSKWYYVLSILKKRNTFKRILNWSVTFIRFECCLGKSIVRKSINNDVTLGSFTYRTSLLRIKSTKTPDKPVKKTRDLHTYTNTTQPCIVHGLEWTPKLVDRLTDPNPNRPNKRLMEQRQKRVVKVLTFLSSMF